MSVKLQGLGFIYALDIYVFSNFRSKYYHSGKQLKWFLKGGVVPYSTLDIL